MLRSTLALLMLLPALAACGSKTDDRIKALEARIDAVEKSVGQYDAVTLKPGQTGYSLLGTDLGRVAVAIAKIEPAPNGTRLTLDFGNPTSARLTGMKARIEWGANDSRGVPVIGGNVQSTQFAASEPLPPGSWRQYHVDLPAVPPAQLGWIRVSALDAGTVDLLSQ